MQDSAAQRVNRLAWTDSSLIGSYKTSTTLYNPEVLVFLRFPKHTGGKVLDIGCGTGRTSFFLLHCSESYLGIDYSEGMIEVCRSRFPGADFRVSDFSNMGFAEEAIFDLVLFSFNGIDYVGHEQRVKGMRDVHRILKKDGLFVFSSHNRNLTAPRDVPRLRFSLDPRRQMRFLKGFITSRRNRGRNRTLELSEDRYALINDHHHQYSLLTYYIRKQDQSEQLRSLGFEIIDMYDNAGKRLSADSEDSDARWIYYVARKAG